MTVIRLWFPEERVQLGQRSALSRHTRHTAFGGGPVLTSPIPTVLQAGDVVSLDVSVFLDGVHGDCCGTFAVGEVDNVCMSLVRATNEAVASAISICGDGVELRRIGDAIWWEGSCCLLDLTTQPAISQTGTGST